MQNTGDKDPIIVLPAVKNDVLAVFQAAKSATNLITPAAKRRIFCQGAATIFNLIQVTAGLRFAPRAESVSSDVDQDRLGSATEAKTGHH
jgi:hypothetical protein